MVLIGLSGAVWAQQTTQAGKPDQATFDPSKREVTCDISRTETTRCPNTSGTTTAGSPADLQPIADPTSTTRTEERMMGFQTGGLLGLVVLIADIWAIIQVFNSGVSTGAKLGWTLLILLLPVVGLLIWFFMGPRPRGTALV